MTDELEARAIALIEQERRRSRRRRLVGFGGAWRLAIGVLALIGAVQVADWARPDGRPDLRPAAQVVAAQELTTAIARAEGDAAAAGTPSASGGGDYAAATADLAGVVRAIAADDDANRAIGLLQQANADGLSRAELEALAPQLEGAVSAEQLEQLTSALDRVMKTGPLAQLDRELGGRTVERGIGVLSGRYVAELDAAYNSDDPATAMEDALSDW